MICSRRERVGEALEELLVGDEVERHDERGKEVERVLEKGAAALGDLHHVRGTGGAGGLGAVGHGGQMQTWAGAAYMCETS